MSESPETPPYSAAELPGEHPPILPLEVSQEHPPYDPLKCRYCYVFGRGECYRHTKPPSIREWAEHVMDGYDVDEVEEDE